MMNPLHTRNSGHSHPLRNFQLDLDLALRTERDIEVI